MGPEGPYSFVWNDQVAIGSLSAYAEESVANFGFVMNVARELSVDEDGEEKVSEMVFGREVLHARLVDVENFVLPQVPEILRAVALVRKAHDKGHTILVTCYAGRNRSGVVVAEHLIQLGNDPQKVVKTIQQHRSFALTNRSFVKWLLRARA